MTVTWTKTSLKQLKKKVATTFLLLRQLEKDEAKPVIKNGMMDEVGTGIYDD